MSSLDGGRTWLPFRRQSQGRSHVAEANLQPAEGVSSTVMLILEVPGAATLFPQSAAFASSFRYLNGDEPDMILKEQELSGRESKRLEPIVEVFEAQPTWIDREAEPKGMSAVVVISRAIPRPTEVCDCALAFDNDTRRCGVLTLCADERGVQRVDFRQSHMGAKSA